MAGLGHLDIVLTEVFKAYTFLGSLEVVKIIPYCMPLGSTTTHEPTCVTREAWVRWKFLEAILDQPLGANGESF